MGKVISKIVEFVKNTIMTVVSSKIGATAALIVSGILLGPLGVVGAAAFQKSATDQKIIELKNKLKEYIDAHKQQIEQAEKVSKILENNFFNKEAFDGILSLGQQIKGNLSYIIKDQKEKIQVLKNISWAHGMKSSDFDTSINKTNLLTQSLINAGRAALDIFAIASGVVSGNVLSIGLGVFDLGMMTFSNIKGIYQNIEQISNLENEKEHIQEYFKPGGQFQQHMKFSVEYTVDIVSNLCTISILWCSLINQIKAWFQILKIIFIGAQRALIDPLLQELDKNPIDEELLTKIQSLQIQTQKISKNSNADVVKIHELFALLNKFEDDNHVQSIFNKIKYILNIFSGESAKYSILKDYINGFSDITFLINQNSHLFRPFLKDPDDDIETHHKEILNILDRRVKSSQKIPQLEREKVRLLKIVMIVSACTDKFYAQDPKGQKLYGYQLESFVKNRGLINFLDSSTGSISGNIIAVPKPISKFPTQMIKYQRILKYLYQKHAGLQLKADPLQKYSLCICLKTSTYQLQKETVNRVIMYKRIQHNENPAVYYEQTNQNIQKWLDDQIKSSNKPILQADKKAGVLQKLSVPVKKAQNQILVSSNKLLEKLLQDGLEWIRAHITLKEIREIFMRYDQKQAKYYLFLKKGQPAKKQYKYIHFSIPIGEELADKFRQMGNCLITELIRPPNPFKKFIQWSLRT